MASHLTFLSVFQPPATSGNITVSFQTLDAVPNYSIPGTVIALTGGATEASTASTIQSALTSIFIGNNILYNGMPTLSTVDKVAGFAVTRTEHVVAIWSQAAFEMTIDAGSTGAVITQLPHPVFCTLADSQLMNGIFADVTTINGNQLTSPQWQTVLSYASEELSKFINNNIVISTYLHDELTNKQNTVMFRVRPVIDYDTPMIHRPGNNLDYMKAFGLVKQDYRLNGRTGSLSCPAFNSNVVEFLHPFDIGNQFLGTYRAGYQSIPRIVKRATMKIAELLGTDPTLEELKAADFSVKFKATADALLPFKQLLREYML